ncbi:MAG: hypothetical protein MUP58_00840 [Candidatus Nanohaloarchaeota archaeon QJJ-9]|nr:hypothetical protein [Candidatus Nanohaloarchaeota archaeon QJJ-9]
MDEDLKYLLITLGIVLVVGAAHNVTTSESDAINFGYCDTSLTCQGFNVGNACIGIEKFETECYEPGNATDYRRVEAECGLLAQNYCYSNDSQAYKGTEWASEASYMNKTCEQWSKEEAKVDLIGCNQTMPPVRYWKKIK